MKTSVTIVTERGQVSIPALLRKDLGLKPGCRLRWEKVSPTECRVRVEPGKKQAADPVAALGFGPRALKRKARSTAAWMKDLREGER